MDIYVARQPIFKKNKIIYAYELLFRDSMENFIPNGIDGDVATSKVLSASFLTMDIEAITGGRRAFINFTPNLLLKRIPMMFPNKKTVIEVLESFGNETIIVDTCKEMRENGYIIALDNFNYSHEQEPLISVADIVKIDFVANSLEKIQEFVKNLPSNLKLLGEKIETYEAFSAAQDMGFDYFQGYFFCKPEVLHVKELSSFQMNLLQIMAEANKPEIELSKIETLISRDITISYKLMRYINSAHFMRRRELSTIKEAIIYLGEAEFRRFISLIAMSNLASDKPSELIMISCIRAKFCELAASASNCSSNPWELFTLGLFSLIDAILDQPMEIIMKKLPLTDNIINALANRTGDFFDYLNLVENYDKGCWDEIIRINKKLAIDSKKLPLIYAEACIWANALIQ
ncbi:HDOD domain-containing protein [Candidatus Woesearchaeota archaeon]|nr:HDOD domain-containing protein [Candidatus Woesearchaeota archaeon]